MADQIKALLALDDAELSVKLGYAKKIESFKEDLMEADKLTGEARDEVNEKIDQMLTPNIWPEDLKHSIERAKRKGAKGNKTTPASVLDGCCEMPEED